MGERLISSKIKRMNDEGRRVDRGGSRQNIVRGALVDGEGFDQFDQLNFVKCPSEILISLNVLLREKERENKIE